jgi:uncharacterized membrane protein (UPF0127 family)
LPSFLSPLLQNPEARYRLVNGRTSEVLADSLHGAFDSSSRRKGLLGRESMPEGEALIIAPTNAIHTWFMRFDIDVLFASKDGRIVKIRQSLRPWRMFAALRGYAAIELPAGSLSARKTTAGDTLHLERY